MEEKRKKENSKERSPQSKRHSIKQQLAGILLCVCLVAASMPFEYYGFPSLTAQAEERAEEDGAGSLDEGVSDDAKELLSENAGEDVADPEKEGETEAPEEKNPEGSENLKTSEEDGEDPTEQESSKTPQEEENPADKDTAKDSEEEDKNTPEDKNKTDVSEDTVETAEDITITPNDTKKPQGEKPADIDAEGNTDSGLNITVEDPSKSEADDTNTGAAAGTPDSTDGTSKAPAQDTTAPGGGADTAVDVKFYSGKAGQVKIESVSAGSVFPELSPMAESGWTPEGWVRDSHGSGVIYHPNEPIPLDTGKCEYYGIYTKPVKITYNGIKTRAEDNTDQSTMKAIVYGSGVGYRYAEFRAREQVGTQEYSFLGWAKDPDSAKADYVAKDTISTGIDLELYAIYAKSVDINFYDGTDGAVTTMPAYINEKSNQGVLKAPELREMTGWKALGWATSATEYNDYYAPGQEIPVSEGMECYGIYEQDVTISYDTNTIDGPETPGAQTNVRRANVHGETTYRGAGFSLASLPENAGYTFVDWNTEPDGSGSSFKEYGSFIKDTVLYAQWEDQTPPVLGEASYSDGYQGFFHWIIRKKGLTITIPVSDEGSGVDQAQYILLPEKGDAKRGSAQLQEADDAEAKNVRVLRQYNKMVIQFTIDEDFKGAVLVSSTDKAGNVSAEKRITAESGGVIVEDNAPQISFAAADSKGSNEAAGVDVTVTDAADERISGGLASISYKIDENEQIDLPEEIFSGGIVETHKFTAQISGEGRHTLLVSAVDNAGNQSSRQVTVNITRPQEPDDGDNNNGDGGNGNNNGNGNNSGNGNGNTGNNGNGSGNGGTGNDGTDGSGNNGSDGSGNNGSGSNGSGNNGTGSNGSGNNGTGGSGSNGTGNGGTGSSGTGGSGSGTGTPKTGEFPHMEIYATLGMIAGFSYLLLYFETGKNGMTEEKKDELVSNLIRWAKKGWLQRILALAAIFLLLTYYHSIGKRTEYGWTETLREVSRG